jgi:hypothetical protein
MKPLINLSILFILPLAIGSSTYGASIAASRDDGNYCNARYDFCVSFPSELFTKKLTSDNDDGIRLTSTDGKVCVEASGAYNVGNWSITDLYDFTFQDITADHPDVVKYVDYKIGKNAYEATFQYANELHYYKSVLHRNNTYITLMIAVPLGMEGLLDNLKEEVLLEVHS